MNTVSNIVSKLIQEVSSHRDAEGVRRWILNQRLEPMLFGLELSGVELDPQFLNECRASYFNMTGRSQKFLREAERLVAILTKHGITVNTWRGVFHGRDLYGDPALRYCTDIDLIVSPENRWTALRVMEASGYHLRNRLVPRWYLARHHLHWPLFSDDDAVPVDLHWAIDHPYQRYGKTNYNVSDPVDRLMVAALHAEKESRLRYAVSEDDLKRRLFDGGPILPWVDLAVMISLSDQDTLRRFSDVVMTQSCREDVARSLWVVCRYFGVKVPGHDYQDVACAPASQGWRKWIVERSLTGRLAAALGCRPEAMMDWLDYLKPGSAASISSTLRRIGNVLLLLMESIVCGLWVLLLKCFGRSARAVAG